MCGNMGIREDKRRYKIIIFESGTTKSLKKGGLFGNTECPLWICG